MITLVVFAVANNDEIACKIVYFFYSQISSFNFSFCNNIKTQKQNVHV